MPLQLSHIRCGALGGGLPREARVQLIAARPGPGLLAARGAAADLAVGDRAEVGLAAVAHPARRIVGQSGAYASICSSRGPASTSCSQPLMPQRTGRSFSLRKTPSHCPQRSVGRRRLDLGRAGDAAGRAARTPTCACSPGRRTGWACPRARRACARQSAHSPRRRLPLGGERLHLLRRRSRSRSRCSPADRRDARRPASSRASRGRGRTSTTPDRRDSRRRGRRASAPLRRRPSRSRCACSPGRSRGTISPPADRRA